jgi:hypothetical protein
MTASVIDAYTLLTSLKATGKDANYTAEELVNAFGVAQVAVDLLTVPVFESRMSVVDAKFDAFDAKLDAFRADIKAEVKSSQMQNLLWLSGIMLISNGMVIAVLARAAKLY